MSNTSIIKRKRSRRRQFRLTQNSHIRSTEGGNIRLFENYNLNTNSITLSNSDNSITLENGTINMLENIGAFKLEK